MPGVNNVTVTDRYQDTTVNLPRSSVVTLNVTGSVYVQFLMYDPRGGVAVGSLDWGGPKGLPGETFLSQAIWTYGQKDFGSLQCVGVRVRNAVTGQNAQVTIIA